MQQGPEIHFCSVSLLQLRVTERAGSRAGSREGFKNTVLSPNAMLHSAEQPMESLSRNQRAVSADKHIFTQHALTEAQLYVFKHIGPTTCRVTPKFRALEEGSELKLQLPKPQGACAYSDTLLPLPSGFRTLVLTLKA